MWLYGKIHSLAMESLKFQYSLFIWWRCTELNYRRLKNQYFSRYHSFWWHGKILIVYFPAFFPSSSSYFFLVYINKSVLRIAFLVWKWSNGISWTVRDTHQMYFVWIVFYIEMEMWCILFVFFISVSNENRLLHYLRRSITTHTK